MNESGNECSGDATENDAISKDNKIIGFIHHFLDSHGHLLKKPVPFHLLEGYSHQKIHCFQVFFFLLMMINTYKNHR